jgi:fatty-acyl-CoA synthase
LPDYARPLFLRFRRQLETTGTFKQRKVDLLADGFDPSRIFDPLYLDHPGQGRYVPLDEALHEEIVSGRLRL